MHNDRGFGRLGLTARTTLAAGALVLVRARAATPAQGAHLR
jgi:hypothetical protein